jgi:PAS domain S-box-containing protein
LLIEAVHDYAIFMLSPSGHVTSWNSGAQKIKEYAPEEIIGHHFSAFYPPEDVAAGKPERELAIAAAHGRIEDEGWRVRRDGSRFWADVIISAVYDDSGALRGFAKVTRDMTERIRLAELEQANKLSAQIQGTREEEQKRIARELHDDLGQQITALKMGMAVLEGKLARSGDPAHLVTEIQDLQLQIDAMMASVRRITADLRPPMLDDLGLAAAIEWLAGRFSVRYGVQATTRVEMDDLKFTAFASMAIFRMVQEALTNVARHANASEARIEMSCAGGVCTLQMEDNGAGAILDAPRKEKSFGLLGMRERVRQLNGTVTIDSAPGSGFRIAIQLPVSAIESQAGDDP